MTEKAARYIEEAKQDERSVEETLADLRERNSRLDWDVEAMLSEVISSKDREHRASADD
jgi:hypothetical protein